MVFFAEFSFSGIPGCAKSALCKELLNDPEGLGDDRPVHSLMGDLIKGMINCAENYVTIWRIRLVIDLSFYCRCAVIRSFIFITASISLD